jgi:hypothetical protein
VPRLEPLPEPAHLAQLKCEVLRRWGTVELLHLFKEAVRLAGFTDEFASGASREVVPREQLRRRPLLALFALGTNTGISRMRRRSRQQAASPQLVLVAALLEEPPNRVRIVAAVDGAPGFEAWLKECKLFVGELHLDHVLALLALFQALLEQCAHNRGARKPVATAIDAPKQPLRQRDRDSDWDVDAHTAAYTSLTLAESRS